MPVHIRPHPKLILKRNIVILSQKMTWTVTHKGQSRGAHQIVAICTPAQMWHAFTRRPVGSDINQVQSSAMQKHIHTRTTEQQHPDSSWSKQVLNQTWVLRSKLLFGGAFQPCQYVILSPDADLGLGWGLRGILLGSTTMASTSISLEDATDWMHAQKPNES